MKRVYEKKKDTSADLTAMKLEATIKRRSDIEQKIIAALAHYTREQAMVIIMSWQSITDLENMAKTILKEDSDGNQGS